MQYLTNGADIEGENNVPLYKIYNKPKILAKQEKQLQSACLQRQAVVICASEMRQMYGMSETQSKPVGSKALGRNQKRA